MTKIAKLSTSDAEKLLLKHGFILVRSKGSNRIYMKGNRRQIIPFHASKNLHPIIVKKIIKIIEK